uniref:DNA-directed DNA polymerase n=1 Tax=Globodera pallida TaxID=36090 RepID=A0A183CBZ4_GLOPA
MGWRLVTFDLETMQHAPANPDFPERRKHEVNFITAEITCPDCISSGEWKESLCGRSCNICGPHRTITFSQMPFNGTVVDKQIVSRHPLVDFVKWILYKLPLQFDTVAYSHFGGRFDMVLVFRELFMEGLNPSMIKKGNRLFEMKVKNRRKKNPNVIFRDSWNLIPGPLASMVPIAEFLEMTKRLAGSNGKADRAAYKTPHNGIDPVRYCVTIASACMRHFRTNHLRPGHLALVPEKGYDSCGDNQSELALNFMEWYAEKVGNFRLDGWIESQQKGMEIHGCVWHACCRCYPDEEMVMPCGDGGPINIRGCFMGGRTGALKLFHAAAPDEKISYYDFTSLYPFINLTGQSGRKALLPSMHDMLQKIPKWSGYGLVQLFSQRQTTGMD